MTVLSTVSATDRHWPVAWNCGNCHKLTIQRACQQRCSKRVSQIFSDYLIRSQYLSTSFSLEIYHPPNGLVSVKKSGHVMQSECLVDSESEVWSKDQALNFAMVGDRKTCNAQIERVALIGVCCSNQWMSQATSTSLDFLLEKVDQCRSWHWKTWSRVHHLSHLRMPEVLSTRRQETLNVTPTIRKAAAAAAAFTWMFAETNPQIVSPRQAMQIILIWCGHRQASPELLFLCPKHWQNIHAKEEHVHVKHVKWQTYVYARWRTYTLCSGCASMCKSTLPHRLNSRQGTHWGT